MKAVVGLFLFVSFFVATSNGQDKKQKHPELKCWQVKEIIDFAENEFKNIRKDLDYNSDKCNVSFSKNAKGVDSTVSIQFCKDNQGLGNLRFNLLVGSNEAESDAELSKFEKMLDECLINFAKHELKIEENNIASLKRNFSYSFGKISFTVLQYHLNKDQTSTVLIAVLVDISKE